MSTDLAAKGKPEKHPVYKFFTDGFVQGVVVFIALAVAFSGKLDSKGTLVAILVAGAIGAIGIYTHCSSTVRRRIIAGLLILAYGCGLWAFYSYLTSKTPVSAGNATIQQQTIKPEEKMTEEIKTEPSPTPSKTKSVKKVKPSPKQPNQQQSGNNNVQTGAINQGSCNINQRGGSNNQATTNCTFGDVKHKALALNVGQADSIADAMRPFPGFGVRFILVSANEDDNKFVDALGQVFDGDQIGWGKSSTVIMIWAGSGTTPQGLSCSYAPDAGEAVEALGIVLQKSGVIDYSIPCKVRNDWIGNKVFNLYVTEK
jgi:hypothetical protein